MVIYLNYGHFEKKFKSMVVSQNHYLNQILDVHPLYQLITQSMEFYWKLSDKPGLLKIDIVSVLWQEGEYSEKYGRSTREVPRAVVNVCSHWYYLAQNRDFSYFRYKQVVLSIKSYVYYVSDKIEKNCRSGKENNSDTTLHIS